ncbi:MAG TPA: ORF6N domain-containing protein [Verrucomicrobiota bacterium]|nr:DNA-binding protein [Verrucomicrobiales bacterium]HRI15550.1 ORF6N domain-containing protein [Verrucomicrobiota bacterium]
MSTGAEIVPVERIERRILLFRGHKVLLDFHLAELYEVEARSLNQAVKRNRNRFPNDFMFRLSAEESLQVLRSVDTAGPNSSQIVTSSRKHRGLSYRPYAFTEQGVAMLSSVLRSPSAVEVNIAIMRTFVQLRRMLASNTGLARRLDALEAKYDGQFKAVFDAIRELMSTAESPSPAIRREIGFHTSRAPAKPRSRAHVAS